MKVSNIRTFIPSKDFEVSKTFYTQLGFTEDPVSPDLSLFENSGSVFFLQRFYTKEFAENLMFQLVVDDIEKAYANASMIEHKTKLSDITQESWGKVFYLHGPAGELWHVTQLNEVS